MTEHSEEKNRAIMYKAVSLVCDQLSDTELAGLNLVAQLDQDPHNKSFYDKAESLFTENNGTKMHQETKLALAAVARGRLFKEN